MMSRRILEQAILIPSIVVLAGHMAFGGATMAETPPGGSTTTARRGAGPAVFSADAKSAVVRYQIEDVERAIAFYTQRLGFEVTQRAGAVFATVSRGDLHLLLSGPGSSGRRPIPDGRKQEPGGWNRIVLYVDDLDTTIAGLQAAGTTFRNEVEAGPGGRQIQVEDPDGNPIELHEAPRQ
jgi:catechol 2,3-dioxygenase-like lactoylglutathione lyase family enzyme